MHKVRFVKLPTLILFAPARVYVSDGEQGFKSAQIGT